MVERYLVNRWLWIMSICFVASSAFSAAVTIRDQANRMLVQLNCSDSEKNQITRAM